MPLAYLDGDLIEGDDAQIGALSAAALYGRGVFTTIAVISCELFLWEKHWSRITANAASLGIDIETHSARSVLATIRLLIETDRLSDGKVRMSFLDRSPGALWPEGDAGTSLFITCGTNKHRGQVRAGISPYRVNSLSPLAGLKSCNYLENLLALEEAKVRGFDEAARLNERGYVASGCMSNVFWLKGERLFTPSLATGCLPGTTREYVLENLDCEEVEAGIEDVLNADAVFLTSAGLGVVLVSEIDGRAARTHTHPILDLLPKGGEA